MNKNIIKAYLTKRFITEEQTPGIKVTAAAQKESGKINKAGVKAVEKDVKTFDKKSKGEDVTKKFNYANDADKTYHEEMEILNGQEMIDYQSEPTKDFKDRAKEGIEGSTRMGNKGGKDMGNAEETWNSASDDFGKNLVKRVKASAKKRADNTTQTQGIGDVQIPVDTKVKQARLGVNEIKENIYNTPQMGGVTKSKGTAGYINDTSKQDAEYSKSVRSANKNNSDDTESKNNDNDTESKNNNNPKIKESMKRLKFKKNFDGVGNALKLIPEAYRTNDKEFEMTDGNETYRIRWEGTLTEGKAIVLTASDKRMVNEDMAKMRHLMGYKSQDTLGLLKGNARIDENKSFSDIWDKTKVLLEGGDIESAKAKTGDLDKVKKHAPEAKKHVDGSVSKDKGTQAPAAKEGDLDDAVSHAPEAKAHVEGSVSTEKGTQAPAPKKGEWEKVKKTATEASKHITMKEGFEDEEKEEVTESSVEGTVAPAPKKGNWEDATDSTESSDKGTVAPAPKKGNWEEAVGSTESSDKGTDVPEPKKGYWEDINVPQAAEAKKHVTMKEGFEGEEDEEDGIEDTFNSPDEDEDTSDVEPTANDVATTSAIDDMDDDDDDDVVIPTPSISTILFSPSTGTYWIKTGDINKKVPDKYLSIASDKSMKASQRALAIAKKMEGDDDFGNEM